MSKILIVDDDLIVTELMKALVKIDGHEPTTVNDSRKAMDVANSLNPDLITLDLMMPGLTGFDLCKLLQDDPKFSNIPIIIVSAKDDPESKRKAIELGAKEYLVKPFNVDELLAIIKKLIQG